MTDTIDHMTSTDSQGGPPSGGRAKRILIPAVIFILIGVVRWQIRRKHKPEL